MTVTSSCTGICKLDEATGWCLRYHQQSVDDRANLSSLAHTTCRVAHSLLPKTRESDLAGHHKRRSDPACLDPGFVLDEVFRIDDVRDSH